MTTTSSDCSTSAADCSNGAQLEGQRVALWGKFGGMAKRAAQQLVRRHGAIVIDRPDAATTLLVVGDNEMPLADAGIEDALDEPLRAAIDAGTLEVIGESQLWQRLGLVDVQHDVHQLYTPATLAQLLSVSVSTIRRWQRLGWIVPVREVRRLAYFDFQEVATARRITELLAAGMSPATIEKKLKELARYLPQVKRPLAQLSIIVEGKSLLLRQGDGLVEPTGQLRFDFGAAPEELLAGPSSVAFSTPIVGLGQVQAAGMPADPEEMVLLAEQLEDEGQLSAAADMYRAAMAAGGPKAELCFLLAELLYRSQDLSAARERYYMAIELDEDYVEARANLGCVLAELGEHELAIAAFEGALAYHDAYGDVHYHLARLLDDVSRPDEAERHWQAFLRLSPHSPWADEARERLEALT